MLNKELLLAGCADNQTYRLTVKYWEYTNANDNVYNFGYSAPDNKGAVNPNALYANGSSYAISNLFAYKHVLPSGGATFHVEFRLSLEGALKLPIQLICKGSVLSGLIDTGKSGSSCVWSSPTDDVRPWYDYFQSAVNTTIDMKIIAG